MMGQETYGQCPISFCDVDENGYLVVIENGDKPNSYVISADSWAGFTKKQRDLTSQATRYRYVKIADLLKWDPDGDWQSRLSNCFKEPEATKETKEEAKGEPETKAEIDTPISIAKRALHNLSDVQLLSDKFSSNITTTSLGTSPARTTMTGVQLQRAYYRGERNFANINFNGHGFSHMDLTGANFQDCSFGNCDLRYVTLNNVTLHNVDLRGADFRAINFDHNSAPHTSPGTQFFESNQMWVQTCLYEFDQVYQDRGELLSNDNTRLPNSAILLIHRGAFLDESDTNRSDYSLKLALACHRATFIDRNMSRLIDRFIELYNQDFANRPTLFGWISGGEANFSERLLRFDDISDLNEILRHAQESGSGPNRTKRIWEQTVKDIMREVWVEENARLQAGLRGSEAQQQHNPGGDEEQAEAPGYPLEGGPR